MSPDLFNGSPMKYLFCQLFFQIPRIFEPILLQVATKTFEFRSPAKIQMDCCANLTYYGRWADVA